jgi:hypothetical protein
MGHDGQIRDAAHTDFWRVSPAGEAYLIRGYQEDAPETPRSIPGVSFDLTVPTWRTGEILLHAASLAAAMGDHTAQVTVRFKWSGLNNRTIAAIGNPMRMLLGTYRSHEATYEHALTVQADQISAGLPELVDQVVRPLYELFDFFPLPPALVAEELAGMRRNTF